MIDENAWKKALMRANRKAADLLGLVLAPDKAALISKSSPEAQTGYLHIVETGRGMPGLRVIAHLPLSTEDTWRPFLHAERPPYRLFTFVDWPETDDGRQRACGLADPATLELSTLRGEQVIERYSMP